MENVPAVICHALQLLQLLHVRCYKGMLREKSFVKTHKVLLFKDTRYATLNYWKICVK